MSESVPEPPQDAPRASGNVLARKLGPLPLWAWMGVALAVALGFYFVRQNRAKATAATSAASTPSGTDQSLIPQFVNQTYVNGAPPEAPQPGPAGPAGPPGTSGPAGIPGPTGPTGPTPPVAQANRYPAPTGEKVSKLSNTTAKINWNYITGVTPKPTSYTIAVYQLNGKLAQQITVNAPDTAGGVAQATVSGLHPGWQYNVHVWANGGKVAPPHSTAELTLLWPRGHMSKWRLPF